LNLPDAKLDDEVRVVCAKVGLNVKPDIMSASENYIKPAPYLGGDRVQSLGKK